MMNTTSIRDDADLRPIMARTRADGRESASTSTRAPGRFAAALLVVVMAVCSFGCGSSGGGSVRSGFSVVDIATGLDQPTAIAFAPDGRLFIVEKGGTGVVVKQGVLLAAPFVQLNVSSESERGVEGIAFDPDFATTGFVYIYYTTNSGSLNAPATPKNRVSRFTISGDAAAPGSEMVILDNIPSDGGNHNGGCLQFGPDGKLYVSTGDSGNSVYAQDLSSLAGRILRINKDGSVPADNPFAGQVGKRGEIYCYGLRNPFRFCFRPGTNMLYIGDVGQDTWEEVDVGLPGRNYGWPTYEGSANAAGFEDPIFEYNHNGVSMAIIGGCFLSGLYYPADYAGTYVYADYVQSRMGRLTVTASNTLQSATSFGPPEGLSGFLDGPVDFAQAPDGSVYYANLNDGTVRRIVYSQVAQPARK